MQIDLGKITWKGTYSATTRYEKDDAAFYSGSSYIFVADNPATGTAPTSGAGNATWDLLAAGAPTMTNQGEIVFQGVSGPEALAPGTAGYVLTTRGAGADPEWAVPASRQGTTVKRLPDTDFMYGAYRSGGVVMVTDNYMVHRFTNWAGGNGSCRGYYSTSGSKTGRSKESCQQIRNKFVKAAEKMKYYRVKIDRNFGDVDAVNQLHKHWSCD